MCVLRAPALMRSVCCGAAMGRARFCAGSFASARLTLTLSPVLALAALYACLFCGTAGEAKGRCSECKAAYCDAACFWRDGARHKGR